MSEAIFLAREIVIRKDFRDLHFKTSFSLILAIGDHHKYYAHINPK